MLRLSACLLVSVSVCECVGDDVMMRSADNGTIVFACRRAIGYRGMVDAVDDVAVG